MELSALGEAIVGGALATVLGAALLALLAWLAGPLRWWVQNRKISTLVADARRFRFVFNPTAEASKVITFLPDHTIGEGKNSNESSWRIRKGKLEIIAADGKIYSRFRHDPSTGQLRHTNEPDLRSIHGQYIQPLFVKVARQAA